MFLVGMGTDKNLAILISLSILNGSSLKVTTVAKHHITFMQINYMLLVTCLCMLEICALFVVSQYLKEWMYYTYYTKHIFTEALALMNY